MKSQLIDSVKLVIFALIPLILSIGIIPAIPFSDADSTISSSKSNSDSAFTAATFADKYKDMLFTGKRVSVVIKMAGESENIDPAKRAKEIRYLQSYVLKFLSYTKAVNVVSNPQKNEITAQIDAAWIPILEQRNDVISVQEIKSSSTTPTEKVTSKIWLITSDEFGCSSKNQKGVEFLQSTAVVYFTSYGVESEFDPAQCLYITQVENDPDNFLHSIQNYDLPMIIFDSKISSHLFSLENDHHLKFVEYEKPHIVFCYCSIPAKSHTATWELSHQLSHFILESHDETKEISQDWVHDAESESVNCVIIRRQAGLCSDRWTPVLGNFAMTMMTVKIHPDYFRELGLNDQFFLSQEQSKKIQPEHTFRNMIYDLVPNIDVDIVDLKIIPIDDNPKDPFDDSDVIVIVFEIINRDIEYFDLSDKMFKILVLDPSFPVDEGKPDRQFIIDNYSTLYDADLETRYDDYDYLEIFKDCEYFQDYIFVNQTKTFSICFDVLRKWNNEILNIDGPKHYFLTLMDNKHYNSCPNCIDNLLSLEMTISDDKKILLPPKLQEFSDENDIANLPFWIQKTIDWHIQGKVSETELLNAITFLLKEKTTR